MAELRGRSDTPSEQPDQPAQAQPDRARAPDKPPSNSNDDQRAIWRVMRESNHPAFEDPRLSARSHENPPNRTTVNRDTAKPIFGDKPEPSSTAKPKVSEIGQHGELTPRTLEIETPRESPPMDKDAGKPEPPGRSAFDRLNGKLAEKFGSTKGWASELGSKIDDAVGGVRPTGQHVQHRPDRGGDYYHPAHAYSNVDGASLGAAMLATGMFVGHVARLTYRKAAELREGRNARN